jgi:hypothetical protein
MNEGSCMILPTKYRGFNKVLQESKRPVCFEKDFRVLENFIDATLGKYPIISKEYITALDLPKGDS